MAERIYRTWPCMRRGMFRAVLLLIALFAGACSSGQDSPEAQVRARLKQGEVAAEKRESAVLRQMISDKYADSQGQDKKTIEAILRYYFLRNESIHLLARIRQISFPRPDIARVDVMVAMAGQPIADAGQLERLRADLHRFDITLMREENDWKVIRAEWRHAELSDFFQEYPAK